MTFQSKLLLICALTSLVNTGAYAAQPGLTCQEPGMTDAGYIVQVSRDSRRAVVSESTIAGARPLATLKCIRTPSSRGAGGADQIVTVLACFEPGMADTGYSFTVQAGGIAGLTTGILSEQGFAGATELARLDCRRAR